MNKIASFILMFIVFQACVGDSARKQKSSQPPREDYDVITDSKGNDVGPQSDTNTLEKQLQETTKTPADSNVPAIVSRTICVHSFENIGNVSSLEYLESALAEGIASNLANAPGIAIVERQMLSRIMNELQMQRSDLFKADTVCQLGDLTGADLSLVGSFEMLERLKVNARLVENETGKVICGVAKNTSDRSFLEATIAYEVAVSLGSVLPQPPLETEYSSPKLIPTKKDEARELFDCGDYVKAFHTYCQASDLDLDNIHIHRSIEKCAKAGSLENLFIERYRTLLADHTNNAILHNYLGNAYLMIDSFDIDGEASEQYRKALELDPQFSPPLNNLAIISYRKKNFDEAERLFEEYLNFCPHDAHGWANLGRLYLALLIKDPDDSNIADTAESIFRKSIQLLPESSSTHKLLGQLYQIMKRQADALSSYQRALLLNRNQPLVQKEVLRLQRELGESNSMDSVYDDMATRSPYRNAGIGKLAAQVTDALNNNRYHEALSLAIELCNVLPNNFIAHRLLGRCYNKIGDNLNANKTLERANRLEGTPFK